MGFRYDMACFVDICDAVKYFDLRSIYWQAQSVDTYRMPTFKGNAAGQYIPNLEKAHIREISGHDVRRIRRIVQRSPNIGDG